MEPSDVVLRFLASVGRRSEADFYLALFRAEAKERFAALHVDASVARHAAEAVALDLRFLASLGLVPVVTLGLLEAGDSVEHAAQIRRRLDAAGVPAAVFPPGAGLAERVRAFARAGTIPIIPFATTDGSTYEARLARLAELLGALHSRKLIFLARSGGLRTNGQLVPVVNLTTDFEAVHASPDLSRKQRTLLQASRRLVLEMVPHGLGVAITSPFDLLRELFTVKGAGTLLRRGAAIARRSGYAEVDVPRVRALLASSFGRPPLDSLFVRPVKRIYIEERYRGVAIVEDTPLGAYLCKFAVDREAQGEGMGRDLWQHLADDEQTVFWRARTANPICAWYGKICDGLVRVGEWHVFWVGLAHGRIPDAISHAMAAPIDIPPVGGAVETAE